MNSQSLGTLYVTGATGFVGRFVVSEALRQGFRIKALVRPASEIRLVPDGRSSSLEEVRLDLRSPSGLTESLADVDTVIHLAAAKAGDFADQFAGTVAATENLLTAMTEAGVNNLVGIGTFSVYDFLGMKPGSLLDEDAPTDDAPQMRGAYAQTKLIQESLYREFGDRTGTRSVVLRPGMIYGRNHLWHDLLGSGLGPRFLRIGSKATLPLTYVENCAEAIVNAARLLPSADGANQLDGQVINIVDDDLPTQSAYAEAVSARMETPPVLKVPWPVMDGLARSVSAGNRLFLDGRAKFPGIAVPDQLHARFKPLRYTNAKAKRLLQWSPRFATIEAIERSLPMPLPDA